MRFPSRMRALVVAALVVAATAAFAQTNTTPLQPFVFPSTVGTSPVLVLPQVDTRRSVEFCNPNATAVCAVCPVRSKGDSSAITCAVYGAGSVTLPASWCWAKTAPLQGSPLPTAWNAVCSAGGSKLSVFTTE